MAGAQQGPGSWEEPDGRGGPGLRAHLHRSFRPHVRAPAEDHGPLGAAEHQVSILAWLSSGQRVEWTDLPRLTSTHYDYFNHTSAMVQKMECNRRV